MTATRTKSGKTKKYQPRKTGKEIKEIDRSLTMKIKDQEESVSREEWKAYVEYLKEYSNQINMQVGFEL